MLQKENELSSRQQLERILKIDRQIRSLCYPNAEGLSGELEVSRRVIFNDRQFMMDRLGAPLAFDRKRRGWYYTESNWALPMVLITEGELLAFFLSVEVGRRYMGTAFEQPLLAAVQKISRTLENRALVSLDNLQQNYTFAPPAVPTVDETALLALHGAIESHRVVFMRYLTASRLESNERTVHPHHLLHQNGEWYLLAFDRRRSKMLTFNVARVEWWTVQEEHFTPDPTFDARHWQKASFGAETQSGVVEVVIRFAPAEAVYIRERRWHETQEIEELPGGGLIMRFQTSGLGAVKRWVLGYGPHAEVLEPVTLREEIVKEIAAMKTVYGEKDD